MALFGKNGKGKANMWDNLFQDVSQDEVNWAKRMTFSCHDSMDMMYSKTGFLEKITMAQEVETVIFFKMIWYHQINSSQTIHGLFFSFSYELYKIHQKMSEKDAMFKINLMKRAETFYFDTFFMSEPNERVYDMVSRYYRALKRYSTDDVKTQINITREEFGAIIGRYLEELRMSIL